LPQTEPAVAFWRRPAFSLGFGFAALVLLVMFKLQPEPITIDALLLDTEQVEPARADELLGINMEDSLI
jgi:hypothetical protein